jgi:hypothetical protein
MTDYTNKAALVVLSDEQLDQVAGGKITEVTTNPKGRPTQGDAAPEPPQDTTAVNPAGKAPSGQNK